MKISTISKVAVSAMALMTLSACAKGGGSNNNNRNNRNGYYNNGYYNRNANGYYNNGQIGQQPVLAQQQYAVGSTYPQPVKRVRIEKEEDISYSRVSSDDVDVLDGTILDDSSDCTTRCRPHRHDENCRHDQGGSRPRPSQPQVDPTTFPAPPGADPRVPRIQPRPTPAPTPTPAPERTPEPQAEAPIYTPAPTPTPQPEQSTTLPVVSGPIEIIYKDQLDSRQASRASISQTAYKSMIDELWRRLDLQAGYIAMPLYEAQPSRLLPNGTRANTGYLSSYKANQHYSYVLSELALKLIETGACSFEETRGCVVVEQLPNGSVIGYHMAVSEQITIPTAPGYSGRINKAVLRRDIINEPRLSEDFRKMKRIDTARIVVYSQKNSGSVIPVSAAVPGRAAVAPVAGAPAGQADGITRINTPVDLSTR